MRSAKGYYTILCIHTSTSILLTLVTDTPDFVVRQKLERRFLERGYSTVQCACACGIPNPHTKLSNGFLMYKGGGLRVGTHTYTNYRYTGFCRIYDRNRILGTASLSHTSFFLEEKSVTCFCIFNMIYEIYVSHRKMVFTITT